jgi:hypothetical protein
MGSGHRFGRMGLGCGHSRAFRVVTTATHYHHHLLIFSIFSLRDSTVRTGIPDEDADRNKLPVNLELENSTGSTSSLR